MRPNKVITAAVLLLLVTGGCVAATEVVDPRLELGEEVYVACGACHLPAGDGVVGAFPPLRNRVAGIASTDSGREFLAATVLDGLAGTISVSGATYAGFMQPHRQTLNDEQIAAVLNFVMFELNDTTVEGVAAFSSAEIAAVRAKPGSAKNSAALRKTAGVE